MVIVDNREFLQGIEQLKRTFADLMETRISASCDLVQASAVEEAPSDTGALRASITAEVGREGKEIIGQVGTVLEYGAYVHQGTGQYAKDGNGRKTPWRVKTIYKGKECTWWTVGIHPNPYLERARDKTKESVYRLMGGA